MLNLMTYNLPTQEDSLKRKILAKRILASNIYRFDEIVIKCQQDFLSNARQVQFNFFIEKYARSKQQGKPL